MDNFIDHRTTKCLRIHTDALEQPIQLTNINGTTNKAGWIERYCQMTIQSGHQRHTMHFFKTSLGEDRIIFGYLWLWAFNPDVDWENGHVTMPWPKAWIRTKMTMIATTEEILVEYLRHTKVFDKKEAQWFPPKREEDHAIKLRTSQQGIHTRIKLPLCHPLFLHKEKGRETPTSTRLLKIKWTNNPRQLPTTPHKDNPGTTPGTIPLYQIWYTMGVQQY